MRGGFFDSLLSAMPEGLPRGVFLLLLLLVLVLVLVVLVLVVLVLLQLFCW